MDEKLLNDLLECSVCLERLDTSSKVLPCQHTFCKKCLDEIVSTHKDLRCPECRTLIECRVDELPPNVLLMRILEGMKTKNTSPILSPPKKLPTVGCSEQRPQKPSKQVPYQRNMFARALYNYSSKESGDLSFKKGDMIILRQKVDSNWYQGEANGVIGIFPLSYVQVFPTSLPSHIPQCKALYDFKMNKEDDEGCLSFSKGDVITVLRRIDQNWAEGKISHRIGIFPLSFVDLNQIARALMKLSVSSQPVQSRIAPPTPIEAPVLPFETPGASQTLNIKNNGFDEAKNVLDNIKMSSETTSSSSSTTTTSPNTTSPSDTTSSSPSHSPSHAPFVDVATNRSLSTSNPDPPKRHSFTNGAGPVSLGPHLPENNKRHSAEILSQDDIAVFSSPNTNLETPPSQTINGNKDSKLHRHGSLKSHSRPIVNQSLRSKVPILLPAKHVALYPYKPQKSDEVELIRGQLYMVTECCRDGWYKGTSLKTNCSGVFPGNYVTPAKISVRLLSGKSNSNSSSVHEQKEDNSSFNGHGNDCGFQNDIDESLPLYPPPELPPRSNSPSVHSRVSSWLSEMPSTSSRVRSAPTYNVKSMCCNTASSNTVNQIHLSHDLGLTAAGTVASSTASPSHSISPENLAQKRVRKRCFLTNSVMRSFSNIKIRKSPPPVYSMDNPVFDDNSSSNAVVAPSQSVHTRSDSCPSKLLSVDVIQRTHDQLPLKVRGNHNFKSETQPNGSSVLIHHRKSHSLDTNKGVSVDIKPHDRKIKQSPQQRTQQNMCRCIVAYPPNSEYELELRVGDILYVHKIRQDGWYRGTLLRTGKSGLFPSSFVEKI